MKSRVYTVLFLSIILLISQLSCNKADDKKAATAQEKVTPKVFQIQAVAPTSQAGYARDFGWQENGKPVQFSTITKNKVVFINFWGTWCGPCRHEIPDIISIVNDMKGKDFIVIGIAQERTNSIDEAIQKVQSVCQSAGINYVNFIGTQELAVAYGGISAIPTSFIIDKNGQIVQHIVGMQTKEAYMNYINQALK